MAINVDVVRVETAANRIASHNSKIRDDFSSVEDAINTLNRNWDGSASNDAINMFYNIRDNYCGHRFSVINSLVNLMKVNVCGDYKRTDANIKKNAEAFK